MKVIDLLNKIANGEEVPKHIGVGIYHFYKTKKMTAEEDYDYQTEDGEYLVDYLSEYEYITKYLKKEIETIEEDKEIEKLNLDTDNLKGKETVRATDYLIEGKINELIDEINKLKGE